MTAVILRIEAIFKSEINLYRHQAVIIRYQIQVRAVDNLKYKERKVSEATEYRKFSKYILMKR